MVPDRLGRGLCTVCPAAGGRADKLWGALMKLEQLLNEAGEPTGEDIDILLQYLERTLLAYSIGEDCP